MLTIVVWILAAVGLVTVLYGYLRFGYWFGQHCHRIYNEANAESWLTLFLWPGTTIMDEVGQMGSEEGVMALQEQIPERDYSIMLSVIWPLKVAWILLLGPCACAVRLLYRKFYVPLVVRPCEQ